MAAAQTCDICFAFDTTGSMRPCLSQVRQHLRNVVERLFRDMSQLRVSIIAFGDYCDNENVYQQIDFTNDQNRLVQFIENVPGTGGGDWPEAYEYMLQQAQKLTWTSDNARCLVVVGDAPPHELNDRNNKFHINWRHEVDELGLMGINIYATQCLNNGNKVVYSFFKTMATKTNGYHLQLNQFSYVSDMMLGVAYRQLGEASLQAYQQEVQDRLSGMDLNLRQMFDRLLSNNHNANDKNKKAARVGEEGDVDVDDDEVEGAFAKKYDMSAGDDAGDLRPVPPARFQILNVANNCSITQFVRDQGVEFKVGRGFYQFTKPEDIAPTKQIILRKKGTGELFQGRKARLMAKIPDVKARVKPSDVADYDVFVQSTSANRKLIAGTLFLYEVPAHVM